jgi:predicted DCC family thiol-disulfide oxidoreductase YuxK
MCVLCSANAQLILRHDKAGHFRLASMQSAVGRELYSRFGLDPNDPDSLIVVDRERMVRDSDAVLAIWARLGGLWRCAVAFKVLPRAVRDPLYRWIARNRYRLFGKRETCWLPDPQYADRIL